MKMKTIEQKAQRYDEAIERAKGVIEQNPLMEYLKKGIEYILPELKEPEDEDEKIRKELIDIVAKSPITFAFEDKEKVLAWLEKQKVLTTEEDLQGKEGVLWCIKQAKKYAKNENEMGTCWFAEKWLEKQGEQNLIMAKSPQLGGQKPADKIEPKFKVKYANSEYNVLEIKEIAGVTYYGIEDEFNHIDYVLPENCEIISGYGIKKNGCSFPTKPIMFSEQKPAWSEEDETVAKDICDKLSRLSMIYVGNQSIACQKDMYWLKSLKGRVGCEANCTTMWKPSEKQMEALHDMNLTGNISYTGQAQELIDLYKDLKKLREE